MPGSFGFYKTSMVAEGSVKLSAEKDDLRLSHLTIPDAKKLQDAWLAGGTEQEFEQAAGTDSSRRTVTATITLLCCARIR
jgi:hypothetical protein